MASPTDSLLRRVLPRVIELRHAIHQHPEIAYEEVQTAATIREELTRLGVKHVAGVEGAPTATIGLVGDPGKPCVALRADIDALPIEEKTGLAYASRIAGRMHACGHDGHTANLLGVAAILKSMEEALPVCVKLLFQPAEEGGAGAERLVKAGVLDTGGPIGPKVERVYGLHGWPGLPVGVVSTRHGPLLASTDTFSVTFVGVGCHGAYPHLGRDPIVAAAEAVGSIQAVVSRELDPTEPGLVTVGKFHAGTAVNIIPDEATIEGTIRTLTPEARRSLRDAVRRRCESIAAAHGCDVRVSLRDGYPSTINDPAATDFVIDTAKRLLGADRYVPAARPSMGGEDFSYYLEKVPGNFFMVGVVPAGQRDYPPLHSDRYDFTDAAFDTTLAMFVELVLAGGGLRV